jgi:Tfp pilus assembly protein PilF
MNGEAARAASAFESALAVDPRLAMAHNGLGVIAAQRGGMEEAASHWTRAAELDPRDYRILYNLGDVLIRLHHPDQARPFWQAYLREAPPGGDEDRDRARVQTWLAAQNTSQNKR